MQSMIDSAIQKHWNTHTQTPYAYFRDVKGRLQRLDYDDGHSLSLKYHLADTAGTAGIALWTANGVGDANTPSAINCSSRVKCTRSASDMQRWMHWREYHRENELDGASSSHSDALRNIINRSNAPNPRSSEHGT